MIHLKYVLEYVYVLHRTHVTYMSRVNTKKYLLRDKLDIFFNFLHIFAEKCLKCFLFSLLIFKNVFSICQITFIHSRSKFSAVNLSKKPLIRNNIYMFPSEFLVFHTSNCRVKYYHVFHLSVAVDTCIFPSYCRSSSLEVFCSVLKKFQQNSQVNTCAGVSF